jgi:hypothetical protein
MVVLMQKSKDGGMGAALAVRGRGGLWCRHEQRAQQVHDLRRHRFLLPAFALYLGRI